MSYKQETLKTSILTGMVTVNVCDKCGCIVFDKEVHNSWHWNQPSDDLLA